MNCSKTSCQNLIDEHVPVKEVGGPVQLPGKWGVPAKARKDPTPVNMLEVVKPKYGKVPQHSRIDTEPIDPALGIVDITRVMSF